MKEQLLKIGEIGIYEVWLNGRLIESRFVKLISYNHKRKRCKFQFDNKDSNQYYFVSAHNYPQHKLTTLEGAKVIKVKKIGSK